MRIGAEQAGRGEHAGEHQQLQGDRQRGEGVGTAERAEHRLPGGMELRPSR